MAHPPASPPPSHGPILADILADILVDLGGGSLETLSAVEALARLRGKGPILLVAEGSQPRAWWETQAFHAGWRKHPLYLRATPYGHLEDETAPLLLALEPIPDAALAADPLADLARVRDLHMDMLRETGRRADAHVARYELAAELVRPGDVVIDGACGLGYGSARLARETGAARVAGIDISPFAVAYARRHFASETLQFHQGDLADLGTFADASVDLVVSFETIEHLEDYRPFLAEVVRVLKPGGRLVASVPNRWVDDSGDDPNPHHHHVFDWQSLRAALPAGLSVERQIAQRAGGGMRHPQARRELIEIDPAAEGPEESEWCLLVAAKAPAVRRPPHPRVAEIRLEALRRLDHGPAVPPWRGEDLAGKRLLAWSPPDLGLGAALLAAGTFPELMARAEHLIIDGERRLHDLFARSFPGAGVRVPEEADLYVSVEALPRLTDPHPVPLPGGERERNGAGCTLSSPGRGWRATPGEGPGWLIPDPARTARWRTELTGPRMTVGLCWRGRRGTGDDLEAWAPVLVVPGVRFISLQYDPDPAEIAALGRRFGVSPYCPPNLDLTDDLDGVAALMAALDLVITAPTSVGDLAGALGVPVWRCGWDDAWMTLNGRHPAYPSMRVFPGPAEAGAELALLTSGLNRRR